MVRKLYCSIVYRLRCVHCSPFGKHTFGRRPDVERERREIDGASRNSCWTSPTQQRQSRVHQLIRAVQFQRICYQCSAEHNSIY